MSQTVKYYNFDSQITDTGDPQGVKPVSALVDFINHNEGELRIGFCSNGGEEGLSRYLLDVLNHQDNYKRITLTPYNEISSAAFEIAYLFRGTVKVQQNTVGIIHYGACDFKINDAGKFVYDSDEKIIKGRKSQKIWSKMLAKRILKKKEYKKFKKGHYILIPYKRMKKIFHKQRYENNLELLDLM